jgi:hypothetical protein
MCNKGVLGMIVYWARGSLPFLLILIHSPPQRLVLARVSECLLEENKLSIHHKQLMAASFGAVLLTQSDPTDKSPSPAFEPQGLSVKVLIKGKFLHDSHSFPRPTMAITAVKRSRNRQMGCSIGFV